MTAFVWIAKSSKTKDYAFISSYMETKNLKWREILQNPRLTKERDSRYSRVLLLC